MTYSQWENRMGILGLAFIDLFVFVLFGLMLIVGGVK